MSTQPAIFSDRIALVTGGSRGIGRATCKVLAKNGARVAINYAKNEEAAKKTLKMVEEAGSAGMIVKGDVSSETDVNAMVSQVRSHMGGIDLLVNNAGVATSQSHRKISFQDWKRMFEVNVDGVFLTTWAVKDDMISRHFGRIVNVASLAGVILKKDMIHYATAKAAVISFTRHCAEALAPDNVRVNCVAPGSIDFPGSSWDRFQQNNTPEVVAEFIARNLPMRKFGWPEPIGETVAFLASDRAGLITGACINVDGGQSKSLF